MWSVYTTCLSQTTLPTWRHSNYVASLQNESVVMFLDEVEKWQTYWQDQQVITVTEGHTREKKTAVNASDGLHYL